MITTYYGERSPRYFADNNKNQHRKNVVELAHDENYIHIEPIAMSRVIRSQLGKVLIAGHFKGYWRDYYTYLNSLQLHLGRLVVKTKLWPFLDLYNSITSKLFELGSRILKSTKTKP